MKGIVLLGVEYLEECRRGVAVVRGTAYLVNLIEDEYGVVATGFYYVLEYAAGHCTDVGAAVSAYLGLIVDATKRHTHIFALQRLGNGLAKRGLAYSRRAVEADDGGFQVATHFYHCKMLEDALFYLVEAVVVAVEYLTGVLHIKIVVGAVTPGKCAHYLQVVELHVVVGGLWVDAL